MIIRYGLNSFKKHNLKNILCLMFIFIVLSIIFFAFINIYASYKPMKEVIFKNPSEKFFKIMQKVIIPSNSPLSLERNNRCSYYNCFNVYRCGKSGDQRIQVYIYPLKQYINEFGEPIIQHLSKEFYLIMQTVLHSKYYTSDPYNACIFIPSFDTLAQNNFLVKETSQALNKLPYWHNGENHLIFNFLPAQHSTVLKLATGNAIIAGVGFDSWTYRPSFDLSLPPYLPIQNFSSAVEERVWLVTSSQFNIHSSFIEKLKNLSKFNSELIILHNCSDSSPLFRCYKNFRYKYPDILRKSVFCIIFRGNRLSQPALLEAMAFGCIPIILSDTVVMPFQEIIDWKRAAFFVLEHNLSEIIRLAKSVSVTRIYEMSAQCSWLYLKYFSSIEVITNTTLDILNQRVFPENAHFYEDWNLKPNFGGSRSPLFLRTKSYSQSFTAVVLTYDRIDSLFFLIRKLSFVPSLSMILVIWNNPRIPLPEKSKWPQINKSLKVIQTDKNKLSNRFFPYKEIETEAVLSLDDDISMLTEDELDFGFEVWREFPDRIVGFPSRTHVWDNVTMSWKYESEWTNEISMILTGAAFYHKYWNYVYMTSMPDEIKQWVDNHMNCEDIAMNFLVANVTNKAPIKVAPRKKFKCPECVNTEMLSADLNHMLERSKCINKFEKIFGRMPLRKVEFRADPVLYKDSFPAKLKRFKNVGNL